MSNVGGDIQGYNLYSYCFNNPAMYSDHSGDWPIISIAILLTVVVVIVDIVVDNIVPDAEEHFSRNELNIEFPEEYNEGDDFFEGWDDTVSAQCHQFTAPNRDNKKFVSPDGKYEVIYDIKNKRVDDPRDMGTYNSVPSGDSKTGHFFKDVLSWIKYENSPEDTTEWHQRLLSFFGVYV